MTTSGIILVGRLASRVTSMRRLLDEHLEDWDGVLLETIYLSDVARWMVERTNQDRRDPEVAEALAILDEALASADDKTHELIGTGFLEGVPFPPSSKALRKRLPRHLAAEMKRTGN